MMPDFGDIQTFFVVLLAIIGAIFTADKLLDIFKKRLNDPHKYDHDWREDVKERLRDGDARFEKQGEAISLLIEGQLQILNHMAYGNHTDELKETIDKYQKFLIETTK